MALISLDLFDEGVHRSIFSACVIMVLLLGLTLISKFFAIALMIPFGLLAGVMAFKLFIKKKKKVEL
jgi:hypothetical protein